MQKKSIANRDNGKPIVVPYARNLVNLLPSNHHLTMKYAPGVNSDAGNSDAKVSKRSSSSTAFYSKNPHKPMEYWNKLSAEEKLRRGRANQAQKKAKLAAEAEKAKKVQEELCATKKANSELMEQIERLKQSSGAGQRDEKLLDEEQLVST